jgi:beta-glucosidase
MVRIPLQPGASQEVTVPIEPRSFAYWSTERHGWKVDAGPYEIRVAASSRDVRLRGKIDVAARDLHP